MATGPKQESFLDQLCLWLVAGLDDMALDPNKGFFLESSGTRVAVVYTL